MLFILVWLCRDRLWEPRWLAADSATRFRLTAGLANSPNRFMTPGLTHLAASNPPILYRIPPPCGIGTGFSLGVLTWAALPCPHSRYSLYIPISSTRAHRVHPINIYGRHAHPRSSAGAGAEPSWVQHSRHCLGGREKPPEPLCCLPSPHPVHTLICILATLTGSVQAPVTEMVSTVWVVDAQGSSPGSVSGQDLGTHSPQKDSIQVMPTLISLAEKGHEGQRHDWLRAGHPGHGRAMAAPTCPLSSQNNQKNETLGSAPLRFSLILIEHWCCKDPASSLGHLS